MSAAAAPALDGLQRFLLPGERILWQGRPDVLRYSTRGWWYMVPFGLFLTLVSLSIVGGAVDKGSLGGIVMGAIFLTFGLYLGIGYLPVVRREARRTSYAITDHRVLIASGLLRRSFVELDLLNMAGAELREGRGGYGSITFANGGTVTHMPAAWSGTSYRTAPAFLAIENADRVFETLQHARADLRATLLRTGAPVAQTAGGSYRA